mgnify:CR=1 FL=1
MRSAISEPHAQSRQADCCRSTSLLSRRFRRSRGGISRRISSRVGRSFRSRVSRRISRSFRRRVSRRVSRRFSRDFSRRIGGSFNSRRVRAFGRLVHLVRVVPVGSDRQDDNRDKQKQTSPIHSFSPFMAAICGAINPRSSYECSEVEAHSPLARKKAAQAAVLQSPSPHALARLAQTLTPPPRATSAARRHTCGVLTQKTAVDSGRIVSLSDNRRLMGAFVAPYAALHDPGTCSPGFVGGGSQRHECSS